MATIIIEAALSVAILASSSAVLSYAFSSVSLPYRLSLSLSDGVYDIFSALLYNSTYGTCAGALNRQCLALMLERYSVEYNAAYAALSYGGAEVKVGEVSACSFSKAFCLPFGRNGTAELMCITLCG